MSEFAKKLTLTGASADRLSTLLAAAGFTITIPYTLIVRATKTNTASIYVGSSSGVDDSTGFEIEPGDTYEIAGDRPSPIQVSQYYFYAPTAAQGLEVWLHG
jgi:hypothetical protein